MVSLVNVEAQYRLKDQELGQLSLEVFSSSYIFQDDVFQDTTLTFLAFSEAEWTFLCINKAFPNHFPISPTHDNCLITTIDRLNPKPGSLKAGTGTVRKELASELLVTQQTLETMSLANLSRFFTTEILAALDSYRNWIQGVLRLFPHLDYFWGQTTGRSKKGSSMSLWHPQHGFGWKLGPKASCYQATSGKPQETIRIQQLL